MNSAADATHVVDRLNGKKFASFAAGAELKVAVVGESRSNNSLLAGTTHCFVLSGLSHNTNEQQILSFIQKYAGIKNAPKAIFLRQHPFFKDHLGFAQIDCANAEDATKCVENLRMKHLNKKKVWTSYKLARKTLDRKAGMSGKSKLLLIAGLHWSLKDEDISKLCSEFGEVSNVHLWLDASGFTRGMAMIEMASEDAATKAFDGLNGRKVKNLTLITAFTETDSAKLQKNLNKKAKKKKQRIKKSVMKKKGIVKKVNITRNNKKKKVRLDGVGVGKKRARGAKGKGKGKKRRKKRSAGPKRMDVD